MEETLDESGNNLQTFSIKNSQNILPESSERMSREPSQHHRTESWTAKVSIGEYSPFSSSFDPRSDSVSQDQHFMSCQNLVKIF